MVFSSIGSALSFGSSPKAIMATLCFFCFWLGFGIGDDYPLSATIMAEYSAKTTRGVFIAAVFAMQGFGILASSAVAVFISPTFSENCSPQSLTPLAPWGPPRRKPTTALPVALTHYWRLRLPETPRYTALGAKD
ncbi:Major facilitator, sugar transporter-like [Trema orientale]|uniref:Major facilitator, sugar transporter-like n=1 Tax=Trema orientale TaxID=63057 RepID=A0A2P5E5R9_TREOI|nr:Major facilitator, sugar transporter-like [Trema orientale]